MIMKKISLCFAVCAAIVVRTVCAVVVRTDSEPVVVSVVGVVSVVAPAAVPAVSPVSDVTGDRVTSVIMPDEESCCVSRSGVAAERSCI